MSKTFPRRQDADLPPRPGTLGEADRQRQGPQAEPAARQLERPAVFSSDGKRVAAFVAVEDQQQLVSIDVKTRATTSLAEGYDYEKGEGTVLGPVIDWQPVSAAPKRAYGAAPVGVSVPHPAITAGWGIFLLAPR